MQSLFFFFERMRVRRHRKYKWYLITHSRKLRHKVTSYTHFDELRIVDVAYVIENTDTLYATTVQVPQQEKKKLISVGPLLCHEQHALKLGSLSEFSRIILFYFSCLSRLTNLLLHNHLPLPSAPARHVLSHTTHNNSSRLSRRRRFFEFLSDRTFLSAKHRCMMRVVTRACIDRKFCWKMLIPCSNHTERIFEGNSLELLLFVNKL